MRSHATCNRGTLGWCAMLIAIAIAEGTAAKGSDLLQHAVLAKYPSPEDLSRQIAEIERDHPGVIQAVRQDFDLAIRSALTLEPPGPPEGHRRVALPKVPFLGVDSRDKLEALVARIDENPEHRPSGEFYRAHFEELVFDETPDAPLVLMDVLANGWDDWSAWNPENDRLRSAREKWPEVHRCIALDKLQHECGVGPQMTGILLRILLNARDPLRERCRLALQMIGNSDVLQFYIDWALDPATSNDKRWELWTDIQMIMGKGDRAFWEPYLDSEVPTLWYCAQKVWDRQLPEDPDWLRRPQGQWNYEHERDPIVRRIIDLRGQIAEIRKDVDPVTNRISLDQLAEIQALQAEVRRLEEQEHPPQPE